MWFFRGFWYQSFLEFNELIEKCQHLFSNFTFDYKIDIFPTVTALVEGRKGYAMTCDLWTALLKKNDKARKIKFCRIYFTEKSISTFSNFVVRVKVKTNGQRIAFFFSSHSKAREYTLNSCEESHEANSYDINLRNGFKCLL